jgi:O-methyltransferase
VIRRLLRRGRWELQTFRLSRTARAVRRRHLTYLSPKKLRTLERCVDLIEDHQVPGDILEAGVALGGSAILLSTRAEARRFHGYDVFGMIPPPGEKDPPEVHERYATIREGRSKGIGSEVYYGYRDDLFEHARRVLAEFGAPVGDRVQLKRGLFEDTLHPTGPVALAHVDSDWYEPVRLCLSRIAPHVPQGGLIVLDDYHDYGGCRQAAAEFLSEQSEWRVVADAGSLVVGRVTPT